MPKLDINKECPLLSQINTPEDLRRMPIEELPKVCGEIREFLIDTLSRTPGHFASNMGTVEITVALHYVYNTPYDRIVWDVGHQAYVHKVLTNRRDRFGVLRKQGGLSGFPNPEESEYDSFIAGHASNSISAALGMAMASKLSPNDKDRKVVAVIGDASISGGLAFEGINNASLSNSNLLIILNDNDMAIDPNVGALNDYMTRINTSKSYNKFRFRAYSFLKRLHLIDEKHRGLILRFNNSIKALFARQQNIFEGLNIRYFGPYDGHDVERIVRVLNDIKDMDGPRLLHLRTRKGKGYKPAEEDPVTWHAPGPFIKETGERIVKDYSDKPPRFQDVFGNTIIELARKNEKIVGVTAAMPSGCSLNLMLEAMPQRSFDVGIAEEHAVTFSAGMAKDGLVPFCCIYSTFLQRAYDEIIHDVAIQHLPVVFCIDRAGLVGDDGVTHHGVFDMAYLSCIPGFVISSPINEHYLRHLMYTAQMGKYGPFAIRYPRGCGVLTDWQCEMHELPVGKGRKLHDGDKVAVLTIGPVGNDITDVLSQLGDDAQHVAHYDMIFLSPIDVEILTEVGTRFTQVITVEDGVIHGGLGSAVIDWFNDHNMAVHVTRFGVPERFIAQGTIEQLRKECGMDNESIKAKIVELIKKQ